MQDPGRAPDPIVDITELEGAIVSGRSTILYRVGALLQRGETASIYAATDEFGSSLALKLYHCLPAQGEEPAVQWRREQQLMSRLNHPHVLRLRDALRIDGRHALILERADSSLEDWILRRGPLEDSQLRVLARQLLDGLHAIHQAGIVHLDVSPLNVLVRQTSGSSATAADGVPQCWIGDFGIAVLLEEGVTLQRPSSGWALLPPELLLSGDHTPTPRCDLYGLGLTLLFASRARLPLTNSQPREEVARLVLDGEPCRQAAQLGTPLGRFLTSLLQVDPARRPASALQAWRALKVLR